MTTTTPTSAPPVARAAFHASLPASDLERSRRFYEALLGVPPAKVRPGYVRFELPEPPLVLSLLEGKGAASGGTGLSHLGVRLASAEELGRVRARWQAAGLAHEEEPGAVCCFALADKLWARDPDGTPWEFYVKLGEDERRHAGESACGTAAEGCCA